MNKEIQSKISQTKALKDKSVGDILQMPEFRENIAAYLKAQREDRAKTKEYIQTMAKMLNQKIWPKTHVIDRLDYLNPDNFAYYFAKVTDHRSNLPKSERDYIEQLGCQALNKTIADFVIAEFPEYKEEFYPSNNKSNEKDN